MYKTYNVDDNIINFINNENVKKIILIKNDNDNILSILIKILSKISYYEKYSNILIQNNIYKSLITILLKYNNITIILYIPIIFKNLCYNNEYNKLFLYISGGINVLLQILSTDNEELQENILSCLINLLSCIYINIFSKRN